MFEVFRRIIDFIGRLADWVHSWTGVYLPWWLRILIAIFWDIIDISLRIIFWFLPLIFPFIGDLPGMLLDLVLAFFGAILWGRIGVAQLAEVLIAPIPVVGYILDLIPVLTIAGFIYRNRYPQIERRIEMKGRGIEMSGNFRRLGLLIVTGLFSISVGMAFYYYFQSPETYRKEAWVQIKKEGTIAGKAGEISDKALDKALKEISKRGKKLKKIIIKGEEYLVESAKDSDTGVEPIDELKDKILGFLKKEGEEGEEKKITPEQEKEIRGLELGPVEKLRYFSDSTLEKAKEIKSRKFRKALFGSMFFGLIDIFFFIGRFPWLGRRERSGRDFDPNDLI